MYCVFDSHILCYNKLNFLLLLQLLLEIVFTFDSSRFYKFTSVTPEFNSWLKLKIILVYYSAMLMFRGNHDRILRAPIASIWPILRKAYSINKHFNSNSSVCSGGLVVKHSALGAKNHKFDPIKK